MKKLLCILLLTASCTVLRAQCDSLQNKDSVKLQAPAVIRLSLQPVPDAWRNKYSVNHPVYSPAGTKAYRYPENNTNAGTVVAMLGNIFLSVLAYNTNHAVRH